MSNSCLPDLVLSPQTAHRTDICGVRRTTTYNDSRIRQHQPAGIIGLLLGEYLGVPNWGKPNLGGGTPRNSVKISFHPYKPILKMTAMP